MGVVGLAYLHTGFARTALHTSDAPQGVFSYPCSSAGHVMIGG